LVGRKVVVPKDSAYSESVINVGALPVEKDGVASPTALAEALDADELAVLDDLQLEGLRAYLPDVKPLFPIATERPIAFALRPDDAALRSKLDAFLIERAFRPGVSVDQRDLPDIKKRGTLRVLTRNNAVSFFLYRGNRDGFDYELAKGYANSQGLMLEVVVAPTYDAMIQMLEAGNADFIAASLTATPERATRIAFTRPYLKVTELFVQKKGSPALTSLDQLRGRTVTVRPSSSYAEKLRPLANQYGFTIAAADERDEVEDLLADVDDGVIELTVADSHFFEAEAMFRPTLEAPLALSAVDSVPIAFATRTTNPRLLASLDAFVARVYRGTEYNILKKRAFGSRATIAQGHERASKTGSLSPFDAVIRQYSDRYGFDWRLMSAQAWRESKFDPKAKSGAGAIGLFQVLPSTGRDLGFTRLTDPDQGAHAGIKYMSQLVQRVEPSVPIDERVRFALAGYNAGFTRVQDARKLATSLKLNPDVWAGNVEKAMLLMARPRYSKNLRAGFCRCQEPVDYVRVIENKYESFVQLVK
ncbi:MAG: transporter substrate-binding domain-containing protein, partial [Archangium sp.]